MKAISVDIVVNDLQAMLSLYNRIEVYRSTTGDPDTYVEITNVNGPTPAIVDASQSSWGNLSGLSLSFFLDGEDSSINIVVLPNKNPMPLQSIINAINEVVPGLASEVPTNTNRLRLSSISEGTGASIQVVPGDVATALGLSITKINGKERRIRLVNPTTLYSFVDKDGDNSFWYKTRFSNTTTSSVSDFSDPKQGGLQVFIPSPQLVQGTLDLVDGFGRPVIGRRIIFIPGKPASIPTTSAWVVPGFDSRVEIVTNEAGHASATLLRNTLYRVIIEGTAFIREFTTPNIAGAVFDILAIAGTAPDAFDVVKTLPRPIKLTI